MALQLHPKEQLSHQEEIGGNRLEPILRHEGQDNQGHQRVQGDAKNRTVRQGKSTLLLMTLYSMLTSVFTKLPSFAQSSEKAARGSTMRKATQNSGD